MSIRFKFKSSVNFDTLEIGNRSSISVGELRARILRGKVSQQHQQGFDLVFSDAVSGLEYKSDDSQIPVGSSVIVKRVPGGAVPLAKLPNQAVKHVEMKDSHNLNNLNPANRLVDEFDVFGSDLYPMPHSNFPDFNQEFDRNNFEGNKKDEVAGSRLECKKLDSSEPKSAIPRGSNQHGNNMNILPGVDEHLKLNKLPTSNFLAVQSANLPLELKCSLCNNFFKDALMIPCCQHSFCQKCIHQVLMEKGTCPKCFSSKCSVRDLLPNLSLRQAIDRFLGPQKLDADIENDLQKYVPDGESGIQDKDGSCALTVIQREIELPQSSSATGKGSNQVFMEASIEQQWRNVPHWNSGNRCLNPGLQSQDTNQLDGVRSMHPRHNDMLRESDDFAESADFQGENQPVLPQPIVHDQGGGRNFLSLGGHKKDIRNCYTCGSPYHLMRDCPMSHPNPMFQPGNGTFHGGMPGYAPPYWNGSLPPFTPYAHMYSNPAMVPFNASMVPISPWVVPPYVPSMHSSLPGLRGNMRIGNARPRADHLGLQQCGHKRKHLNENLGRKQLLDDNHGSSECYRHNDQRLQEDRDSSLCHSDDSLAQRLGTESQHNKHMHSDERHDKSRRSSLSGRDKRPYHAERSNSGKEDTCRSSDRHGEGRHKLHHGESKKYDERRGHYEGDSNLGHRSTQGSYKKHHSLSSESDRMGGYKEKDSRHDSSRHSVKHSREPHWDDRWQIINGSDEDRRAEYRYHKQRAH